MKTEKLVMPDPDLDNGLGLVETLVEALLRGDPENAKRVYGARNLIQHLMAEPNERMVQTLDGRVVTMCYYPNHPSLISFYLGDRLMTVYPVRQLVGSYPLTALERVFGPEGIQVIRLFAAGKAGKA